MSNNQLGWEELKTDYTPWYNHQYPTPEEKKTHPFPTDTEFIETPGKIKDIAGFMKDTPKCTLACCWKTGNLTYNMQQRLCPDTDYNIDGNFFPSTSCDTMMSDYCKKNIDQEICGCYRTDEAPGDASWRLWKKMNDINPDLSPSCVINRCHTPNAYKPQIMQKQVCPNVCSAVSNKPDSQTYVSVDCSPNDIIVNNIGDITKSGAMHNIYNAGDSNNSYFMSSTFYILLAIILLLFGTFVYKKYKK